jgi:hypothetical protein
MQGWPDKAMTQDRKIFLSIISLCYVLFLNTFSGFIRCLQPRLQPGPDTTDAGQ